MDSASGEVDSLAQEEVGIEERRRRRRQEKVEAALSNASRSERLTTRSKRLVLIIVTYPVTIAATCLFLYVFVSWASFALHASYHLLFKSVEHTPLLEKNVCKSHPLMLSVQRNQLEKAREELKDDLTSENIPDYLKSTQQDYDFGFYGYNLGTLDVEITHPQQPYLFRRGGNKGGGFTSLVYYRIYKAANDHVRGLLFKFAYRTGIFEKDYSTCTGPNDCFNSGVQEKAGAASPTLFFPTRLRRYPFTFVRDPLARFVSGYREIDFRVLSKERANWVMMTAKPGSSQRFLEFIRLILLHNGSQKLFRYPGAEMEHVAPFVGTLLQAVKKEPYPLRLFRVENLERDWATMASETLQPALWQVWSSKQIWPHASSADPYNSSTSAWDLLSPAVNMNLTHYRELLVERQHLLDEAATAAAAATDGQAKAQTQSAAGEIRRQLARRISRLEAVQRDVTAALYLRAICRVYASDYICGGYEFPPLCQDLHAEVTEDAAKHEGVQRRRAWRKTVVERLAPEWLLFLLAELPCMALSQSPPECIGRFVHGDELFDEDSEEAEWAKNEL